MLQKYLTVIVLFFTLMLTGLDAHQLFGEKHTAVKDTYASHGRKLSIQIARSRLDCNRQCRNTEFCNAVNFGNKTCELLALYDDYENHLQSRPGWTLSYMSDACTSEPCQNGGTCHSLIRRYDCDCMPGYTNTACDLEIDECSSNPCQHNGVCIDAVNSYSCECNAGYAGNHCEHLEVICHGGESPALGVNVRVSRSFQDDGIRYDGNYICLGNLGWSTPRSVSQWVEVDIGSERLLVQIATMGHGIYSEWVIRYELYKRDSGNTLIGQFMGNSDQNTPKYHVLSDPITVRIVRIVSLEWHSFTAMRIGLFVL